MAKPKYAYVIEIKMFRLFREGMRTVPLHDVLETKGVNGNE